MRRYRGNFRSARARISRATQRHRRRMWDTSFRIHDQRLPFHFFAHDVRIEADEMERLTDLEKGRPVLTRGIIADVLSSIRQIS